MVKVNDQNDSGLPPNVIDASNEFAPELGNEEKLAVEKDASVGRFDLEGDMNELNWDNEADREQILEKVREYAKMTDHTPDQIMKVVSGLLDIVPLDPLLGELLPVGGDVALAAATTTLYLGSGAHVLNDKEKAEIVARQTVDAGVGAPPIIGFVLDWLSKSNLDSAKVVEQARARKADDLRTFLEQQNVPADLLDTIQDKPRAFLKDEEKVIGEDLEQQAA